MKDSEAIISKGWLKNTNEITGLFLGGTDKVTIAKAKLNSQESREVEYLPLINNDILPKVIYNQVLNLGHYFLT